MKIICIGRNYSEHAKELGNDLPSEPLFFLKPDTAKLPPGQDFIIPEFSQNIHFEVELIFRIDRVGKHIKEQFAHKYYSQIGLGIDFTARDVQEECKKAGKPWEKAKAFDNSAVVSKFINIGKFKDLSNLSFSLLKNGKPVQDGNSKDMIFNIHKIIEHVSQFITLKVGDLIFTGTPSGVGKVEIGDVLEGFLKDEKMFEVKIR